MPNNLYNQNFLETPDPVTGLQRRTGQNQLDHKQTLHERLTLEHDFDPNDASPQSLHGLHRGGSVRAYVTAISDSKPTHRPTGEDKGGTEIPAVLLDDNDKGRLLIHRGGTIWFWLDQANGWVQVDSTPIGFIQPWASPLGTPPAMWLKCDGDVTHLVADYPDYTALVGTTYGGDGITTVGVPNMAGISTMGAGSQADFMGNGNTKGFGGAVGDFIEDTIQKLEGSVLFSGLTGHAYTTIIKAVTGIFKHASGANARMVPEYVAIGPSRGFEIDLDDADVRNSTQTHSSALLVDYYIKVL